MTMRRAHYTWRNDPGTTNKWRSVTVVTNLCSTITYLAPAPITNYISQTRRQGRKNSTQFWVQKGRGKVCFPFLHDLFHTLTLISRDFPQLWPREKPRENANVFPPLPWFSFVIFLPRVWVGTEREIDLFDIFRAAPLGYCPPCHCQCTFQFRLWTYNLSVWVILHKYEPRSYCYLHIPTSHFSVIQISSLLFSNILN